MTLISEVIGGKCRYAIYSDHYQRGGSEPLYWSDNLLDATDVLQYLRFGRVETGHRDEISRIRSLIRKYNNAREKENVEVVNSEPGQLS